MKVSRWSWLLMCWEENRQVCHEMLYVLWLAVLEILGNTLRKEVQFNCVYTSFNCYLGTRFVAKSLLDTGTIKIIYAALIKIMRSFITAMFLHSFYLLTLLNGQWILKRLKVLSDELWWRVRSLVICAPLVLSGWSEESGIEVLVGTQAWVIVWFSALSWSG